MHDSGPGWIATPFLYDSFIHNSTPVYPGALSILLERKVWTGLATPISAGTCPGAVNQTIGWKEYLSKQTGTLEGILRRFGLPNHGPFTTLIVRSSG
jgi:hypothetical protein